MISIKSLTRKAPVLGTIAALSLLAAPAANAVLIDFTGGTVTLNDGSTFVTNGSASFQDVWKYEEDGFRLEFIFGAPPTPFGSIVGDYYNTGNDVIHGHWIGNGHQPTGPYGTVTEIRVSRIDGGTFDLGGFRVSTNTAVGGSFSTGNELTWINSSKAMNIFSVTPDNWGLGSGPDPLIAISAGNTLFDDITWFSFTNDPLSAAVGLGLDNFFLDEAGDPGGVDPTPDIPEPGTLALFGLGLMALGLSRRRRSR